MSKFSIVFAPAIAATMLFIACGQPPMCGPLAGGAGCSQGYSCNEAAAMCEKDGNGGGNPQNQPDMGGGGQQPKADGGGVNPPTNLTCNSNEEAVMACWSFPVTLATASFPGNAPNWSQLVNLTAAPGLPNCVQFCAPKASGWGCIDRHTRQIGVLPGQTQVTSEIGWCGSGAGCRPDYFVVRGARQAARDFLGKCGWPFQIVDGWTVPTGTLSTEHGSAPPYYLESDATE